MQNFYIKQDAKARYIGIYIFGFRRIILFHEQQITESTNIEEPKILQP